jgi:hypothetical protein
MIGYLCIKKPSPLFHLIAEFCQETLTILGLALGCFAYTGEVEDQGVIHGGGRGDA